MFVLLMILFFTEDPNTNMFKITRVSQRVFIQYNWRTDHTQRKVESLVLFTFEILEKSQILSAGFFLVFFISPFH